MATSVAMCTYNGARYIREQLLSILNQTVVVDEIVICDDGSSDDTLSIIDEIVRQTKIPVSVYKNEPPLGARGNFDKAIRLCHGDYVFLADQDDVWRPNKVDVILSWFIRHPKKNVVFTNASFIDSHSRIYEGDKDLFYAVSFGRKARLFFDLGLGPELFAKHNRTTGATMAFRREIMDHIYIDSHGLPYHDEVIAVDALCNKSLGYLNKKLISYRIHQNQTCGLRSWIQYPPRSWNALSPLMNRKCLMCQYPTGVLRERMDFMQYRCDSFDSYGRVKDKPCSVYIKVYGIMGIVVFFRDVLSAKPLLCKDKTI